MMKVGITGGIGSGKSTVCRLFAARGVAVYDSDTEAKRLMATTLRPAIEARFGAGAFRDGVLDRAYLADIVFRDAQALADLDALVHPAVLRDFEAWAAAQPGDYVILESAILFEAGLEHAVDRTVAVLAPVELRVRRTCRRDRCDEEAVRRRIAAQALRFVQQRIVHIGRGDAAAPDAGSQRIVEIQLRRGFDNGVGGISRSGPVGDRHVPRRRDQHQFRRFGSERKSEIGSVVHADPVRIEVFLFHNMLLNCKGTHFLFFTYICLLKDEKRKKHPLP